VGRFGYALAQSFLHAFLYLGLLMLLFRFLRMLPLLALLLLPCAQAADLPATLDRVLKGHGLEAGSYGFVVQEIDAAEPLLAVAPDLPLNPASTIKTLTTLAALETLGPAYTWHTRAYALGEVSQGTLHGDLLLQGGGDPYLLEEQFRNLLKAVRRQGIVRIDGDLVVDTSLFDPSVRNESRIDNQAGRTYNVLPHALSVNFQAITYYFAPAADGVNVDISTDPMLPGQRIVNRLKLKAGACTGFQRGISFNYDAATPGGVTFDGQFPASCTRYAMARAVSDPDRYLHALFSHLWHELGGEFTGNLRLEPVPAEATLLVDWESPPLADVIRALNKYSNNLMARHLLLTLAAEHNPGPATVQAGAAALVEYLQGIGVEVATARIVNGAGLSRDTRLSTAQLNAVLRHGYQSRYMAEFVSSLPVVGEDGTMRTRLRGAATQGYMHVKTGTLDEVSAVAGYVVGQSGRVYAVSGILNHALADRGPGVELMDALLAWTRQQ